MKALQPRVLRSHHSELVHDLRGAILRLSFALKLYRKKMTNDSINTIARRLKRARRIMGDARNLDVLASHLSHDAGNISLSLADLHAVERHVLPRCAKTHQALMVLLKSPWYRRLVRDLESLARRAGGQGPSQSPKVLVKKSFKKILHWRKKKLRPQDLHALRRAFKDLRYTLEFLEKCYRIKIKKVLPQVIEFQDILGQRQDAMVAINILSRSRSSGNRKLIRLNRDKMARDEKKFKRLWKRSWPILKKQIDS